MTKSFPTSATVVVIGGGVMGCSTAYHLAKAGCRDVVLLERKQLTSGTSWHSAAQVRALRSSENLTRMIQYSAELYQNLEAETGQSTGWLKTGSLSLATNQERFTHIKRQASLARLFGVEAEVVSPEEAGRLWPLIRTDDLVGAVWSPEDGRVNPSDLCAALTKAARANGARIVEDAPVTGFTVENGRVSGVETPHGTIACETVALCAGLWSHSVAALAGVSAPLHACEHFYLLTQPMEEVKGHLPTLGDHDAHLYLRDDVGGLLVGSFEPGARAIGLDRLPKDFAFDLLAEDWDHFEPMLMNGIHRIPALEKAEARMLLNGPESFTPDGRFLLGESPELRGFFLGCGMNSAGMASSGGAGRWLAEWILAGEPTLDMWPVDIRRFAPFHNNMRALRERAPEVLTSHYVTEAPHREFETVRDIRHGPLHERQAAKGAHFAPRMGWERPSFYADSPVDTTPTFARPAFDGYVAAEQAAARNDVALFDQSSYGKLRVRGPDAEALLQRLCANDMATTPGRVIYTGMLNVRGGYESDCTVFRHAAGDYLVVTGTAQPVRDMDWIKRNMADEDVRIDDVTVGTAVMALAGPKARELMQAVSDADFSNDSFPYMTWRDIEMGPWTVRAARLSYVGELGWELYMPTEFAAGVYDLLFEAGEDFGLRDAGMIAMTGLRLEKAYRAWGHDLTPETTPLEAGLGFAAKIDHNTPFIGQDALKRQRDEGLGKRLVIFTLDDSEALPIGGEPIVWNGAFVGQVTSAGYGHTLGRGVAIGRVTANGTNVEDMVAAGGFEIEIACERFAASAGFRAPFDPSGERLRG